MAFINKSIYQKNIMQSALNSMPVQVRDRTTPVGAILCQGRNARRASKGNRVNIPDHPPFPEDFIFVQYVTHA